MNWTAEQHRLLGALGYELLAHGRAPVLRATPSMDGARAEEPAIAAAPVGAGVASARLLEALRRAANGADVASLAGDLEVLRRDPALKRALWPRLRALRRSTS